MKRTQVYHIGLGKRKNTLVVEARRNIDFLSCEIYDYLGTRETTKKHLNRHRYHILEMMKEKKPEVYGKLRFAVVE